MRCKVESPTLKPPQTHKTNWVPITGITLTKLRITVAPQRDICPQGKTYPINAAPISNTIRTHPLIHTIVKRNLFIIRPRKKCRYTNRKSKLTPVRWVLRINQPRDTSREILSTEENAVIILLL